MKIIGEYLVKLPIYIGDREEEYCFYKVVHTNEDTYYRENWNKGNLTYELVDKELFYEQNTKTYL